jgi:hypothetical protein
MNQSQAETHELLFKYFSNFMDILRETTKGSVLITGILHTTEFSHISKTGILTTTSLCIRYITNTALLILRCGNPKMYRLYRYGYNHIHNIYFTHHSCMFRLDNAAFFRLYRITTGSHLPKSYERELSLTKKVAYISLHVA